MSILPRQLETAVRAAVRTRALRKRWGSAVALAGVDITVPEGAVYVLAGPNGAGKTTLLKVLLDITVADSGTAEVFGLDTHTDAARARAQIGYVPEREESAYSWMRVADLIRYHAGYYAAWDASYASELARLFELRPRARLGELSKGQQRRVQLLLAMAHRPPLLVLDEPTDGLDPLVRERTLAALADHLARFPTTLLISTHQVHETERLCDHLCVLRAGAVQAQLSRADLRRRLRRYALDVPAGWAGAPALDGAVIQREGAAREIALTVWGDEGHVSARLRAADATIRHVSPLTLQDATVVLLAAGSAPAAGAADDASELIHAAV
jgi:ABC-2 type transport system ATP-binding protein